MKPRLNLHEYGYLAAIHEYIVRYKLNAADAMRHAASDVLDGWIPEWRADALVRRKWIRNVADGSWDLTERALRILAPKSPPSQGTNS